MSKHVNETAQTFISKLRGRCHKRTHGEALEGGRKKKKKKNDSKKNSRATINIIKKTSFPSFNSVTDQQAIISASAAEIASVSSKFDIFAHKPIHTSVLGTTEFEYEPIDPFHQNDLKF